MTPSESPRPTTGQRSRGRGLRGNDVPWPERPLLTALWIPAAAVLLPLGGALGAFGLWMLVPSLALVLTGAVGLMVALWGLCPSKALRKISMGLLLAPLIAVPLLSMNTAQATVLTIRGTEHPGTVADVRVIHGKTTTYDCDVRYDDAPARTHTVSCGAADTAGEHVAVTEDPGGLVSPEFSDQASGGRFDLVMAAFFDTALVAIAIVTATIGALVHHQHERRTHHQAIY
ncbi:hypothetical protein PUR71_35725 [Streptomyces sp. SP17BM10]|uniref:hypothetical protein n=1 Tax=Streptomyces sp. SP17BM10 TaxID=3002530 RepID=UPI002E797B79|nr:hypothetical protein [Streptomyces sp. SP17BM10]MEE1788208.1 hypothetical protein [Streptomyces sp. SP17BM10]